MTARAVEARVRAAVTRWLDRMMPSALAPGVVRDRARLALWICVLLQLLAVVLAGACLAFGKLLLAAALLGSVALAGLVPMLLRRSTTLATHYLAGLNLATVTVIMWRLGGLNAQALASGVTSVMIATVVGGPRIGRIWLGVAAVHTVVVVAVVSGRPVPPADLPLWFARPASVITLAILVYAAISGFERAKDRAIAEQDVLRAELDAVLRCTPAIIMAIAPDGRIQYVNQLEDGRALEDVVGTSWRAHVAADEQPRMAAALRAVFTTGHHQTFELTRRGSGVRPRWLTNRAGPLWGGGRIVAVVIVSSDITEIKLAQAELATAQRLASVGTLAAGVAHELNTPLQFVNDSVQFLRDASHDVFALVDRLQEVARLAQAGAPTTEACAAAQAAADAAEVDHLDEQVPRAFERTVEGLDRVTTIVRSMREFAAPGDGDMVDADLNRAIANTLTVAHHEYAQVADVELDLGELPPVTCHVHDINQVVLSLVANAGQAIADAVAGSGRRGTIRIQTRRDGAWVEVAIADTGRGIPAEIRDRIFEPFFTTREVGRGTGQGLAVARALVTERHGGELSFSTTEGVGTTFRMRLPLAAAVRRRPLARAA